MLEREDVKRDVNGHWLHSVLAREENTDRHLGDITEVAGMEVYKMTPDDILLNDDDITDISDWNPDPPDGAGWFPVAFYEGEDGPAAIFVRPGSPTLGKISDTARGLPLTPATAVVAGLSLLNNDEPPMACCPTDGEPLISTFRYAGAEFVCMICGGLFGFLAPTPKKETPELTARYEELNALWKAGEKPGSVK